MLLKIKARSVWFIVQSILLLFNAHAVGARSYSQCELSSELQRTHLTPDEVRNLVCIAQKFSRFNTNVVVGENFGIFQINQKWCGSKKADGECNIRCDSLLDDDINDDVRCAQKVIAKAGVHAWRIEKTQGCVKELKNLDANCPNKVSSNEGPLQRDYCGYATKLFATYDISKQDALTWSCIAEHHRDTHASAAVSKTGNVSLKLADDDADREEAACVDGHDVECSIKIQIRRSLTAASVFSRWSEYKQFCENISGDETKRCFDEIVAGGTKLKVFEGVSTERPRHFTTSTDVSILIEDDHVDVVTPIADAQPTTEFLMKSLEKPASGDDDDDDMTIEGYSKVRLMFSDKESSDTTVEVEQQQTTTERPFTSSGVDKSLRCDITGSFLASGHIPENMVATFVCIAEHESGLNATLVTESGDGGMQKFGLFQIDNVDYCNTNDKINECDILCAHLTDSQFDNDLECAKHIYDEVGFSYWPSFARHCSDVGSKLLESCRETHSTTHRPYTIINYELLRQKFNLTQSLATTSTESTTMADVIKLEDTVALASAAIRQFDLCEFSQELHTNQNVALNDLTNFVCIADQTSKLQVVETNDEGDEEMGIFGFKSDACGAKEDGGKCAIACSQLFNEDLHDDVSCLNKIYKQESLSYWNLTADMCRPYSNKILQCMDEEKFMTIVNQMDDDDDGEFNLNSLDVITTSVSESQSSNKIEEGKASDKESLMKTLDDTSRATIESTTGLLDEEKVELTTVGIEKISTSLPNEWTIDNSLHIADGEKSFSTEDDKDNDEQESLNEKVQLLLNKTLESFIHMLAHNLTIDEEAASDQHSLNENSKAEDIDAVEKKLHDTLNGILKMLEVNDASEQTESATEKSDQQIRQPINSEQYMITTETPHDSERKSTVSLINLKILTDKRIPRPKSLIDETTTSSESESEELMTTLGNDYKSSIVAEAFAQNLSENDDSSSEDAQKTTTEASYYTSVQELFENLERLDERNIVKRKTTLFPDSSEDESMTTGAEEQTTSSSVAPVTSFVEGQITLPPPSHGIVDKCALTRYIQESRIIPRELIPTFVCIAEHESLFNVSLMRSDGGKTRYMRYGLFQIDDIDYCNTNEEINKCDVLCTLLLDNQFDNDLECALHIQQTEGFKYWPSYAHHCTQVSSHILDECREVFTTTHNPYTPFDREKALSDLFTTTVPTTTTVTIPTTTVYVPKYNYTDDEARFVIRRFDLCELTNEIYRQNVSIDDISELLCVADQMSQLKIRQPLESDERFGVFAINKEYCEEEGGKCGIKCSRLLDGDITDDLDCLQALKANNQTNAWNLDAETCKTYTSKLLSCIDQNEFQTTTDPIVTRITAWVDYFSMTEPSAPHKELHSESGEEGTTTAYYDNGVLTTIEVLKSTQIPATEKKPLQSPPHNFLLPPHDDDDDEETTVASTPDSSSTEDAVTEAENWSSERTVTLSTILEPPHIGMVTVEDGVETTTMQFNNENITVKRPPRVSTSEDNLKQAVSDFILSPDQILIVPKESYPDEMADKSDEEGATTTKAAIIGRMVPLEKSSDESYEETTTTTTTTENPQDESTTIESLAALPESSPATPSTQQIVENHKKILSLNQLLLPLNDDVNVGGGEEEDEPMATKKPDEFLIVVKESTSSEATTSSIYENTIAQTTHAITRSTKQTEATPATTSSPIFRRRTTAEIIKTTEATTEAMQKEQQTTTPQRETSSNAIIRSTTTERYENTERTTSESYTTVDEITEKIKTTHAAVPSKGAVGSYDTTTSSIIIDTLRTTAKETKPTPSTLPQVILNDHNLSKQVSSIIHSVHETSTNGSTPLVFNIYNFNIDGQNHDVKIHANEKEKKP